MGNCNCSSRLEADFLDPPVPQHIEATPLALVDLVKDYESLRDASLSDSTTSTHATAEDDSNNNTCTVDENNNHIDIKVSCGKNLVGEQFASEETCDVAIATKCNTTIGGDALEITGVARVDDTILSGENPKGINADRAETAMATQDRHPKKEKHKDSTAERNRAKQKKTLATKKAQNCQVHTPHGSGKCGTLKNTTKSHDVKISPRDDTKFGSCAIVSTQPEHLKESSSLAEVEAKELAEAEADDTRWQMDMGRVTHRKGKSSLVVFFFKKHSKDTSPQEVDVGKQLEAGATHIVKGTRLFPPWPENMQAAMFGMGCFWCAENCFMKLKGVYSTQVGFAGGKMVNPTYVSVSLDASFAKTGETGKQDHVEVVRVIFDPKEIHYNDLLKIFWERHDPTQGNRQGRDEGYQYRSFIGCCAGEQKHLASLSRESFAFALKQRGIDRPITTEIRNPAPHFWYAEEVHQQYDAKPTSRPYCGLSPTGARLAL